MNKMNIKTKYCTIVFLIVTVASTSVLANHFNEHSKPSAYNQQKISLKSNESLAMIMGKLIDRIHSTEAYHMVQKNVHKINNVTQACLDTAVRLFMDTAREAKSLEDILASPGARMLDAWGRLVPSKVLLGNILWIGAYGECTTTPGAKYCVTPVLFRNAPAVVSLNQTSPVFLSYGSCFPKECTSADVAEVMKVIPEMDMFEPVPTASKCDDPAEPVVHSPGVIATLAILSLVLFLNVVGTVADYFKIGISSTGPLLKVDDAGLHNEACESKDPDIDEAKPLTNPEDENSPDIEVVSGPIPPLTSEAGTTIKSRFAKFAACFSVPENTKFLLSTRVSKGAIRSVNGIRVLSITWVIVGHYFVFNVLRNQPDNFLDALKTSRTFPFQAVLNAYVSVDTFFLLSGLLVSYITLTKVGDKTMKMKNVAMLYVHRYVRLTPTLGLVILFSVTVYPILTSGPGKLINQIGEDFFDAPTQQKNCEKYWWSSLLYLNNFYPENSKNCFELAWYLANDFQFFLLSPFIIMLMVVIHRRTLGIRRMLHNLFFILALCMLSMLVTGVVTGVFDIPALVSIIIVPGSPRADQSNWTFDRLYVKPYTRITPYLVGIFLGYLVNKNVRLKGDRCSKVISVIGWISATLLAGLVVYGPWSVFKEGGSFFSDAENILYSATHRFLWSCAVAWVVFACHNKHGGWIDRFLSWKVWIPVSRLTYGVYLIHLMVMGYFTQVQEVPYHYQRSTAVGGIVTVIGVTYVLAFLMAVLFECPIMKLEKLASAQ